MPLQQVTKQKKMAYSLHVEQWKIKLAESAALLLCDIAEENYETLFG